MTAIDTTRIQTTLTMGDWIMANALIHNSIYISTTIRYVPLTATKPTAERMHTDNVCRPLTRRSSNEIQGCLGAVREHGMRNLEDSPFIHVRLRSLDGCLCIEVDSPFKTLIGR